MTFALLIAFFSIYFIDIALLFYFGIHTYFMVYLYAKNKENCDSDPEKYFNPKLVKDYPIVTIQLPVYNEFYVIDRLIESTIAIKYPKSKLQIQVLDDSTDESKDKAFNLVKHYAKLGHWIEHIHRTKNHGYKAGALDEGMNRAQGEYIAIFDSDFVPDPEFLYKTLGYFEDPNIGMVQTRWGHLNQTFNLLTKAQSYGIDGHFMIEQVARNGSGLWMNFNGTAGIWRTSCIKDSGGWEHDTLTEDFDLSYRAEMKGWKFRYLKDVVCKAEIPATMNAYKSQQFRWCKGSIQTAVKLLPRIWKADLPRATKMEAITHLINYSVHPLMIVNILLTAPLLLLEYWAGIDFYALPMEVLGATAVVLSIGSIGPLVFYAYSQRELYKNWKRRLGFLPVMVMIGTGIAVVNTRAWLEAMLGIQSGFKRTPKLKIESSSDNVKDRILYSLPLDRHVVLEFFMGSYCLFCIFLSIVLGKPYILGFLSMYTIGFYFVAIQSVRESLWKYRKRNVLQTEVTANLA
ncbi:cellulose synthase family protein [Leptospira sp. GIMC2001]|uniref:cellulose synthase family protein n=1 Tax=Leptospira sp. GIMC2001 TaxID=1513297 RepID=UPI00234AD985|nr:cellulose synthase family protein [Leptospira sp. GIMC2001]WCL48750.1 glycosyltransferase family 2 protein [Leptospira sp. GIMC2001]